LTLNLALNLKASAQKGGEKLLNKMAKKTTKNNFDIKQLIDNSGSYKNLIYGAVTVLILAVIVFLGIRTLSQNQGDINDDAVTVSEDQNAVEYDVAEGETLWSISEKVYGTGFNWQVIADANNLEDGNNLEAGTKLTIPNLTPTAAEDEESEQAMETEENVAEATVTPAPTSAETDTQDPKASNATEYTVKHGDNLWKIAVAEYGDGYKWTEIAKANKLANPNLIHSGNKLTLPR